MKTLIKLMAVTAVALALAGSSARAQVGTWTTTNFWIGSGGDYLNPASWSLGVAPAMPGVTNMVTFSGLSGQTITFSKSITNNGANIWDSGVTFDLSGYIWNSRQATYALPGLILSNGVPGRVVKFSSSSAPLVGNGNYATFGDASGTAYSLIGEYPYGGYNGRTQLVIDDSLGYGAKVQWAGFGSFYDGSILVSGSNSELYISAPNSWGTGGTGNSLVVQSNATLRADILTLGTSGAGTTLVVNSRLITGGASIGGYIGQGNLILSNGSRWTASGNVQVGVDGYALGPYRGTVLVDASTVNGQYMTLGGCDGNPIAPGQLYLINGSTMTLSNGLRISEAGGPNTWGQFATNRFIMNNSTLFVGGGTANGSITNYGIVRAAGTITGQGPGNFTFYNGSWVGPIIPIPTYSATNAAVVDIGANVVGGNNSLGALTLNKGNFVMSTNTKIYLEFSNTGLDQVLARDGFVTLMGSNIFSLAAGAPAPTNGVKYGLGVYDFVVGTNVTKTPQYDNLVNLLTNNYHLVYGVDFQYGVVNLGGGLFALELAFVPEPSTVLLLALGGLMVWRRAAKKASRKTS